MCRTTEILEDFETGRQTCTFRKIGRNKKKGRKTERLANRQADICRETKRWGKYRDRKTGRQKERKTERQKERKTEKQKYSLTYKNKNRDIQLARYSRKKERLID